MAENLISSIKYDGIYCRYISLPDFLTVSSFLRAEIWILTEVTTSSWPISWHHSISLSTDSPVANHNPAISHDPTGTENLTSHPKQTKSLNNSNMLHILNNNTYSDFRRAYKHVLIPNYVIRVF